MTNEVHVWRLIVDVPKDVDASCPPKAWLEYVDSLNWRPGERPEFSWPSRRNFLSLSGAKKFAQRLESYGATVQIQRSEPVIFIDNTP